MAELAKESTDEIKVNMANQLIQEIFDFGLGQRKESSTMYPEEFSKLQILALLMVAATFAIDLGGVKERFMAIANAAYDDTYKKFPKWGD